MPAVTAAIAAHDDVDAGDRGREQVHQRNGNLGDGRISGDPAGSQRHHSDECTDSLDQRRVLLDELVHLPEHLGANAIERPHFRDKLLANGGL